MGILGSSISTEGITATAATTAKMIAYGLIFVAIVGLGAYLYLRWRQQSEGYKVIIYSQDGFKQITQRNDIGTIYVDRITKNKRLFLKKSRVGLEADKFPFTMGTKGEKTIYLLQTGLKNYRFITIAIDVPKAELKVGEEDVNWALNEFDRAIKMFEAKSFWKEYGPYLMFIISVMAVLIVMIVLIKKFDVIQAASENLKQAAQYIAQAKAGTMVMT